VLARVAEVAQAVAVSVCARARARSGAQKNAKAQLLVCPRPTTNMSMFAAPCWRTARGVERTAMKWYERRRNSQPKVREGGVQQRRQPA